MFSRLLLLTITGFLAAHSLAVETKERTFAGKRYLVTTVDLEKKSLQLFLGDGHGKYFNNFENIDRWLVERKRKLVFAMNAGMFHAGFAPVGLFVDHGRTIGKLNLDNAEGNFFLEPNGVFAITESGASVIESSHFPALAAAARTVGSPQIRNAGTIGGNVGTGSPAGDTLPVLAALDAIIHLADVNGSTRSVPWQSFFLAPKRTARKPTEIITGVELPLHRTRQDYLKVGTRNAMVISVAGLALVVDLDDHAVRVGLGSVGPVPLRAPKAEAWVVDHLDWADTANGNVSVPDPRTYETFGTMVAKASKPIDDQRSTAEYRKHAVKVLAQRALMRLV